MTQNSQTDKEFQSALKFDLDFEGRVYENVAGDSGGPTKFGITWTDANQHRREHGLAPLTEAEAANTRLAYLTPAIIDEIYYNKYWLPMKGADLPSPLGQVLFDCSVNVGIFQSVKFLQGILGTPADGQFGPATLAATKAYVFVHGQAGLCGALVGRREAFYQGLAQRRPKDAKFLRGWLNRCAALLTIVKKAFFTK